MARDISTAIESLLLDGAVCLYPCCKQTMNNWVKDINDVSIDNNYDWRVVGSYDSVNKKGTISSIPKERYNSIKHIM